MDILTRQDVLAQLRAAAVGELDTRHLAAWAFEQFYVEEAGAVQFEPGYRWVIRIVLDDLMFGDEEPFRLTRADMQRLIQQLEQAGVQPDDELDNDANEYEDDDA